MEGALVFASIILGVGVTDELMSLHRLIRVRQRVRWDWAVPAIALLVLLTVVQIWWSIQGLRGPLTIGAFLPVVVELVLLFLLAAAVLPDQVPDDGLDLRTYYDENGSYIWSLYAAALGWWIVTRIATEKGAGASVANLLDSYALDVLVFALMISLIFVRRRWWHAVVLLILYTGPIGWLSRSLG
jgi:hypothetical protein